MVQPANKRLLTEAAMQDPESPTRKVLNSTYATKAEAGQGSANAIESRAVADLFASRGVASNPVGITFTSADRWTLKQQVTPNQQWRIDLYRIPGLPGGKLMHQLQKSDLDVTTWSAAGVPSYTYVDQEDASIVHTSASSFYQWLNPTPQAAAYGGSYRYSNVAGDNVTWTTPAGTTYINLRTVTGVFCGYALAEIDGSKTAANQLTTAQAEVDAGRLASSALVGNGGTLNPTDRLIDAFTSSTNYDATILLAKDLTAGAHAVKLTVTGYKRVTSATDARLMSSGFGYASAAPAGPVTNTRPVFPNLYAAFEYALDLGPSSSGSHEYVGNVHGFETQNSIKVYVDGLEQTSQSGTVNGDEVVIVRDSTVADTTYLTGKVWDARTMYRMTRAGLEVVTRITFAQNVWAFGGYLAMFPVADALNRGVLVGLPGEIDLSLGSGGAGQGKRKQTQAVYAYDAATGVAALMYLPDLTGVNGWANSPATDGGAWIEDRSGNTMNKMYAARFTPNGKTQIAAGTVLRGRTIYRATAFADAALAVGQA